MCQFLEDDLEIDPELLKGIDRMKAQGTIASASGSHIKYKNKCFQNIIFMLFLDQLMVLLDANYHKTVGTSDLQLPEYLPRPIVIH